jgi:hypothetical protein
VSPTIEASQHARILPLPAEPPVAQPSHPTICSAPTRTPLADSGCELLPCAGSCPRLCLAFLATMRPAFDPFRPPAIEPSLLVSPLLGGPARIRHFMLALHLHQCNSSSNLHQEYSVHTTLLITHHNRERPSIGPWTLRSLVQLRRIVWISFVLWFCGRSDIDTKPSLFRFLSPHCLVASNFYQV